MSRLKLTVFCFLLAASCLIIAACSDPDLICDDPLGCVRVGADEPLQLGYLLALSGEAGYLGEDSLRGVEIALAERDNMFMGHPVELIGQDTGCRIEEGRLAALATADNPLLVGVIGPTCSAVAERVIPIINRVGLVMISPSSMSDVLPFVERTATGEWQQSFYRTIPNTLWQGAVAAEFAVAGLGVTTAVVIHDETEGSDALRQAFAEAFMALGGRVVFVGQVSGGQTDVADVIALINAEQPDLLYLPLFEPEANLLINNLPDNWDGVLLGPDSLLLSSFAESAGTAVQGMALTGPAATGAAYEAVREQWVMMYGDEPIVPYHAYAYDAANMLLTAIAEVVQEGGNGVLLIGRQALRDALTEMQFSGVSGQLVCQSGECSRPAAIGVYQLTEEQIAGESWPPPLIWQLNEQR